MTLLRDLLLMLPIALFTLFYGCKEVNDDSKPVLENKITKNKSSFNTHFDGQPYSIPSVIPTILKLRDLKIPFDSLLVHPTEEVKPDQNKTDKAIKLGVYRTDIIYTAVNQESEKCLSLLHPVQLLAKQLDLAEFFNSRFSHQFKNSIQQEGSVLSLMNSRFSKVDFKLKANDDKNTSALILAGGWLKSLYITTQLYKEYQHSDLLPLIGQQKKGLETILKMIEKYNINGQNDKYIADFTVLSNLFEPIKLENEFTSSRIDRKKKSTSIKCKTKIQITPEVVYKITNHVEHMYKENGSS